MIKTMLAFALLVVSLPSAAAELTDPVYLKRSFKCGPPAEVIKLFGTDFGEFVAMKGNMEGSGNVTLILSNPKARTITILEIVESPIEVGPGSNQKLACVVGLAKNVEFKPELLFDSKRS